MTNSENFYHKLKLLSLEYDDIIKLDEEYMKIFLEECISDLNLQKSDFENNSDNFFDENDEKQLKNINHSFYCIQLYRKLAKILHPDKNKNSEEDFIKLSKAYEKDDFITLFILSYENNIKIHLSEQEIEFINLHIQKKENEMLDIKNKIHWKWVLADNDLEKYSIREHIINNN